MLEIVVYIGHGKCSEKKKTLLLRTNYKTPTGRPERRCRDQVQKDRSPLLFLFVDDHSTWIESVTLYKKLELVFTSLVSGSTEIGYSHVGDSIGQWSRRVHLRLLLPSGPILPTTEGDGPEWGRRWGPSPLCCWGQVPIWVCPTNGHGSKQGPTEIGNIPMN